MRDRRKVKILVTDYDNCAFQVINNPANNRPINKRPDLLSPFWLQKIAEEKFDVFYGCTHRCLMTAFEATFVEERITAFRQFLNYDFEHQSVLTSRITENIQKATGLACYGVSTPDDSSTTAPKNLDAKCGYGYEHFTKPYEEKLVHENIALINNKIYSGLKRVYLNLGSHQYTRAFSAETKNKQLIQIAHHAASKFPDCDIDLVFFDDVEEICVNASCIFSRDLPKNVRIIIKQLDSYDEKFILHGENIPSISSDEDSEAETPVNIHLDETDNNGEVERQTSPSPQQELAIKTASSIDSINDSTASLFKTKPASDSSDPSSLPAKYLSMRRA